MTLPAHGECGVGGWGKQQGCYFSFVPTVRALILRKSLSPPIPVGGGGGGGGVDTNDWCIRYTLRGYHLLSGTMSKSSKIWPEIFVCVEVLRTSQPNVVFVCVEVEVLWPSQPNGVMSSVVSLPNHTWQGMLSPLSS